MIDDLPICAINATNKTKTHRHGIHEKKKKMEKWRVKQWAWNRMNQKLIYDFGFWFCTQNFLQNNYNDLWYFNKPKTVFTTFSLFFCILFLTLLPLHCCCATEFFLINEQLFFDNYFMRWNDLYCTRSLLCLSRFVSVANNFSWEL